MRYEWDDVKNQTNYVKHGVWFEEAQTLWATPKSLEFYDSEHSLFGEERFIRIGFSYKLNLLLVVFCEQCDGKVVRIISARLATLKERVLYEKRI